MIPSVSQDGGLPRIATGSASTSPCFGACTAFTCVAACLLAEPPEAARCLEGFDGFVTSAAAPIATGWSDQLSGQELHLLKKPDQTAPLPQPFSSRTDRPIVSLSAWLALADWFRRHQRRDHGEHPCDAESPPIAQGRHPTRSGPQCPTPLAGADSRRADPADPDLASPSAAAPPGPKRQGGLP